MYSQFSSCYLLLVHGLGPLQCCNLLLGLPSLVSTYKVNVAMVESAAGCYAQSNVAGHTEESSFPAGAVFLGKPV